MALILNGKRVNTSKQTLLMAVCVTTSHPPMRTTVPFLNLHFGRIDAILYTRAESTGRPD